jgi:hypothetical protein
MNGSTEPQRPRADRDGRGRFAQGNKAGKGNPHHRRVAELRATMLERVTSDDITAVVDALLSKAKAGDTAAIKLLLDRIFGRIADHDAAAAEDRAEVDALWRRRSRGDAEESVELFEIERPLREAEQLRSLASRARLAGLSGGH